MTTRKALVCSLTLAATLALQAPVAPAADANIVSQSTRQLYGRIKGEILKAAEEMPESDYSYQPTPKVRTFGQLVAHVADGQYEFCSAFSKTKEKNPEVEKTVTGKTELIAALKTAFSYCDKTYEALTDEQAVKSVDFFGRPFAAVSVLDFNTAHNNEHYGNMVTYLRMKGLVPPSSKQ